MTFDYRASSVNNNYNPHHFYSISFMTCVGWSHYQTGEQYSYCTNGGCYYLVSLVIDTSVLSSCMVYVEHVISESGSRLQGHSDSC